MLNNKYKLIVKDGEKTVGFLSLNDKVVGLIRYVSIYVGDDQIIEYDMLENDLMTVDLSLGLIQVEVLSFDRAIISQANFDLNEFKEVAVIDEKKEELFERITAYVATRMDNPAGMTEVESAHHTAMLSLSTSDENAKKYIMAKITQTLLLHPEVDESSVAEMAYLIYGNLYGMGVLQELDDDPEMGEIMVNAFEYPKFHCDIYYIKNGVKYFYDKTFKSLDELKKVFNRTIQFDNREINSNENAQIEASRPNRDRVTIVVPDASDNWIMNIRKFTNFIPSLSMMKQSGTVDGFINMLNELLVEGRANIGIGGAMGTGKTTYINYLLSYTPKIQRKVIIASVSETDIDRVLKGHDIVIFNVDDRKNFTFKELLRTSLRTTADRVIIPESRGGEFKELYEANLKTKGNMFTAHALDDESFMDMCCDMYLSSDDVNGGETTEQLRNKIAKALDFVIINRRVGSTIRSKSFSEVLQDEKGNYAGMNPIYTWVVDPYKPSEGRYELTGNKLSKKFLDRLVEQGIPYGRIETLENYMDEQIKQKTEELDLSSDEELDDNIWSLTSDPEQEGE